MTSFDCGVTPALGPRLTGLVDALFGFDVHPSSDPPDGSGGADAREKSAFCVESEENR